MPDIRLGTTIQANEVPSSARPSRAIHHPYLARHGSAGSEARSSTSVSQVRGPDFVPETRSPRTAASLIGRSGEAIAADAAAEFRWSASASTFVIAASRAIFAVATSACVNGWHGALDCRAHGRPRAFINPLPSPRRVGIERIHRLSQYRVVVGHCEVRIVRGRGSRSRDTRRSITANGYQPASSSGRVAHRSVLVLRPSSGAPQRCCRALRLSRRLSFGLGQQDFLVFFVIAPQDEADDDGQG
jgi:hypothetical protein